MTSTLVKIDKTPPTIHIKNSSTSDYERTGKARTVTTLTYEKSMKSSESSMGLKESFGQYKSHKPIRLDIPTTIKSITNSGQKTPFTNTIENTTSEEFSLYMSSSADNSHSISKLRDGEELEYIGHNNMEKLERNENLKTLTSNNSLLDVVPGNITVSGVEDTASKLSCTTQLPISSSSSKNIQPHDLTQPCSAVQCDKTWNPVCDSQNKTHKNMCLFKFYACKKNRINATMLELAHEGECGTWNRYFDDCPICSANDLQVLLCDNLNKTHHSLCAISQFNCVQKKLNQPERVLVHTGPCNSRSLVFQLDKELCPQKCGTETRFVCDEAGMTYMNLCLFQQKNCLVRKSGRSAPMLKYLRACDVNNVNKLTPTDKPTEVLKEESAINTNGSEISKKIEQFECPEPTCSEEGLPVCDTKGILHHSVCHFNHARCLAAQQGVTLSIQEEQKCLSSMCDQECSDETKFVCGNDFITYKNLCFFNKKRCIDSKLELLFIGRCDECLNSRCPQLSLDAPDNLFVCDQQSITRTICEYQMLSCIMERSYGLKISIQHLGRCCEPYNNCETKPINLLCGSDGRTYKNECFYKIENCRNEKMELPVIHISYEGECNMTDSALSSGTALVSFTTSLDHTTNTFGREKNNLTRLERLANHSTRNIECAFNCDKEYSPVCGTDDITHSNLCTLQQAKCWSGVDIHVAYKGECCDMDCPNNFSPICDNQGNTHQNLCFFGKERCIIERITGRNISIEKFDVCNNTESCDMECPKTYHPICGSHGDTIINECEMKKLNCFVENNITTGNIIVKEYDGECCPDQRCNYMFSPICDSEGVTHANECVFRQKSCVEYRKSGKNITVKYKGQCCSQPCEDEYKPVCDGTTTHDNMCRFRISQCEAEKRDQVLTLVYAGECCSLPTGQCEMTRFVCDSDGQTHANVCRFQQKKCILERTIKKLLSIVHSGECCVIEICRKEGEPVCDSRGNTHASLCHFQNSKCIHDKIHPHNTLMFAYKGSCCPNKCNNQWEPVCDQHGNVYKNQCSFSLKSCELNKRSKTFLLQTPCPERRAPSTSAHKPLQHANSSTVVVG